MATLRRIADSKRLALLGLGLCAALGPCIASASLGEPEASVQVDAATVKASVRVTDRTGYRVHEIQLSSGTVVREFSRTGGMVFAVAWSGPSAPNLRQTLGKYFDDWSAAARLKHSGHHHLTLQRDDLVIQSSGHMRSFSGRAYLPQAVPGGVALGELR